MRKLIAITHITLDGVMQAPGGPDEVPRGGFAQFDEEHEMRTHGHADSNTTPFSDPE